MLMFVDVSIHVVMLHLIQMVLRHLSLMLIMRYPPLPALHFEIVVVPHSHLLRHSHHHQSYHQPDYAPIYLKHFVYVTCYYSLMHRLMIWPIVVIHYSVVWMIILLILLVCYSWYIDIDMMKCCHQR